MVAVPHIFYLAAMMETPLQSESIHDALLLLIDPHFVPLLLIRVSSLLQTEPFPDNAVSHLIFNDLSRPCQQNRASLIPPNYKALGHETSRPHQAEPSSPNHRLGVPTPQMPPNKGPSLPQHTIFGSPPSDCPAPSGSRAAGRPCASVMRGSMQKHF
jgi:hypothetical protein